MYTSRVVNREEARVQCRNLTKKDTTKWLYDMKANVEAKRINASTRVLFLSIAIGFHN